MRDPDIWVGIKAAKNLVHHNARKSGWWEGFEHMGVKHGMHFIVVKLALAIGEISEAIEAYRRNEMDDHLPNRPGIEVEIADAIIRLLDVAGALRLDVEGAVLEKLEYNAVRADHKPENREKGDGKKF